jgi:hypothetical protein
MNAATPAAAAATLNNVRLDENLFCDVLATNPFDTVSGSPLHLLICPFKYVTEVTLSA